METNSTANTRDFLTPIKIITLLIARTIGMSKRKSIRSTVSEQDSTPSSKRASKYDEYADVTNDDLRTRLKEFGEDPGPINDGNRLIIDVKDTSLPSMCRDLYVRQLMRKESAATPLKNPATTRILTATPTSTQSPSSSLIGRSGGGRGTKKVATPTITCIGY